MKIRVWWVWDKCLLKSSMLSNSTFNMLSSDVPNRSQYEMMENSKLENKKKMSYQEVIVSSIGEFGLSQLIVVLACKFPMIPAAWSMIMMSFAGAEPDWWKVSTYYNATANTSTVIRDFKSCSSNGSLVFDQSKLTIVNEWGLICDEKWIRSTLSTTQMVGVLVGAFFTGQLGDWIGRKKTVIFIYTMDIVFIFTVAFSFDWKMMIVCLFFLGFSLGGFLVISTLFVVEFVGTKWRTIVSLVPFWGTGVMLFGILFKILPNWRHICITIGAIGAPFIVLLFFVPESVRWLFSRGEFEKGKDILRKLAARNKKPNPDLSCLDEIMKTELEEEKQRKKYTYWTLIKTRTTRLKSVLFGIMWFYMASGYYGLTLGVSSLVGDLTLNMVLMGLGEMTCLFFVWLLSKCLGRKYTTLFFMLGTGLTSFGITIAYYSASKTVFETWMNILAITSRFMLSAAWASVILFTIESFPTVIRSAAFGLASSVGRVGGIAGTQYDSLSSISLDLPFTVNGILGVICALFCLLLEDTYHAPLEDHIEETSNKREQTADA